MATNVAARGLDILEVDLVVKSCPPKDVASHSSFGENRQSWRDRGLHLFLSAQSRVPVGASGEESRN